jgi:hypothetical protein
MRRLLLEPLGGNYSGALLAASASLQLGFAHEGVPRALLGQLARLGQYDLRLPAVIADLPRHTDALAAK